MCTNKHKWDLIQEIDHEKTKQFLVCILGRGGAGAPGPAGCRGWAGWPMRCSKTSSAGQWWCMRGAWAGCPQAPCAISCGGMRVRSRRSPARRPAHTWRGPERLADKPPPPRSGRAQVRGGPAPHGTIPPRRARRRHSQHCCLFMQTEQHHNYTCTGRVYPRVL